MPEDKTLRENKLGVTPIGKLMLTMSTLPMISMIANALYNIVESVFVAQISEQAFAGITLVLPVQMILINIGTGSGIGTSSLIARRLGAGRNDEANSATTHGFIIAFANWAVFAVFGLFLAEPFFRLFTSNAAILASAVTYGKIVTIGSLFAFVVLAVEKILQATGNMLFPMIFTIVGAGLNSLLSPLLILGLFGAPRLGVTGAAIACIASQFTAMCLALFFFFKFKHYVTISLRGFRPNARILRDIYAVGFPTIVNMSMVSVMTMGLNAILIAYSETAVAVFGAYYRLISFAFMPIFGLSQGAMPIHGYNFGARNKARLLRAYKMSVVVAVSVMAVMMAVFLLFPAQLMSLFSPSPEMYAIGIPALRIVSLAFLPAAYAVATSCLFQGLAHGFMSLVVSFVRQLVMTIPMAWLFIRLFGVSGVWWAVVIAEAVAAFVVAGFYRRIYRIEIKHLGEKAQSGEVRG
ncbi:MAG: MATE family efflux transporter [Clostridiales Family XIII bacterium]|jgi:putative MATE family efflux protein|nr:MATE family efflux transporter [Clostridiales Family XIII bacterium]